MIKKFNVYNLLKEEGMLIFEQPNFTIGALSLKFDQIYHEHISYFTATNIKSILNYNNFKINHLSKNDYHGGSLRTIAIDDRMILVADDLFYVIVNLVQHH